MKVYIKGNRNKFNRISTILLFRDIFEMSLTDAKNITDKIVNNGRSFEFETDDLSIIERIGKNGLNLRFSYMKGVDYFEGSYDSHGLSITKLQTEFTNKEVEDCLKEVKCPVLIELAKNDFIIIDSCNTPNALLIENDFLAKKCVEYLLNKGVRIVESINEL